MKVPPERGGWYPLARATELRSRKPLRRYLFGTPILLFGTAAQPRAMVDRCPHRGAPLSQGHARGDSVQCPYHGWTFRGDGQLASIPCLTGIPPDMRLRTFETCVHLGLVFVKVGDAPDRPYLNPLASQVRFWRPMEGGVHAALGDAAENFLDPVHTVFVHRHLVRAGSGKPTTVEVTGAPGLAEARYYGEGNTGGLVGTLMREESRALSVGRFIAPNVSEVEFHGPGGVNFIMTGFMTPARDGELTGYGVVGLPGPVPWAWAKFLLLWPWIRLVHSQDRRVLESTVQNNRDTGLAGSVTGPLDLMRPQIDAILAGRIPPAAQEPLRMTMLL